MTNDKGKYSQYLTVAGNYFANKGWVHLLLAGGLYMDEIAAEHLNSIIGDYCDLIAKNIQSKVSIHFSFSNSCWQQLMQ